MVAPRKPSRPRTRPTAALETRDCTTAEMRKPRTSGQRTSQNMKKAICRASQIKVSKRAWKDLYIPTGMWYRVLVASLLLFVACFGAHEVMHLLVIYAVGSQ